MTSPQDDTTPAPLPPAARFLKRLVLVMTVVMVAAFLAMTALALRLLTAPQAAALPLPPDITLPTGARAAAFTQAPGWFAVVTEDDRILIYDRASGRLRQTVDIVGD
jgi:hypothetical protein